MVARAVAAAAATVVPGATSNPSKFVIPSGVRLSRRRSSAQSRDLAVAFRLLGLEGSCSCDRRATFLLTPKPLSDKQVSPPIFKHDIPVSGSPADAESGQVP